MPETKPITTFAEAMVKTHYGRRSLGWIGDRLAVLTGDSPKLCRAIGTMAVLANRLGASPTAGIRYREMGHGSGLATARASAVG
jgi:hypothetical protein